MKYKVKDINVKRLKKYVGLKANVNVDPCLHERVFVKHVFM